MDEREEFLKLTQIISTTASATTELLDPDLLSSLDEIFGGVLEKLNGFFKKVERSFRDFVVFERYITCAHTRDIGYDLRSIPEEIKQQVWELRDNTEVCGFTGEECICKKSSEYLKNRFLEKVNILAGMGKQVQGDSRELRKGLEMLEQEIEFLTFSVNKIREIAEVIEMVALNAYIEAARLGEQGRGFKVIADEVRKASMRTDELASEIVESIKSLQKRFLDQIRLQDAFDKKVADLEREQTNFSEDLNRDLLWMTQNFMDFLEYVRVSTEEDMHMLEEVKNTILSVLQTVDLASQKAKNAQRALCILADMVDEFQRVLKREKDINQALVYVSDLYEEFRRIPKLREEREVIARAEGNKIDHSAEVVGEKLEDVETDVELF